MSINYRSDIDGLRAIAVILVIFFHLDLIFSGGFIGVDVFFVISGYLITTLIIRDLDDECFSLSNFFNRRIRRITPAYTFMLLTCMIISWFLLLPSDLLSFAESFLYQTFFSGNLYFWKTIDYFNNTSNEFLLLHSWSLALEEQFYLLYPIIFLLSAKNWNMTAHKRIFKLLLIFFLTSLTLSIIYSNKKPDATFFLLPTRAWELLCGGLIVFIPKKFVIKNVSVRNILSFAGMLGIVIPAFIYDNNTIFPGLTAVPPCLGTAFLIYANISEDSAISTYIQNLLSLKPIVFLGQISYSLYLWHWPIIVFYSYTIIGTISIFEKLLLLAFSFFCSVISWKYIESPFRNNNYLKDNKRVFLFGASSSMLFITSALLIIDHKGFENRFSKKVNGYDLHQIDTSDYTPQINLKKAQNEDFFLHKASSSAAEKVIVWGDSLAGCLLPGFIFEAKKNNFTLAAAWHAGTAPALDYVDYNKWGLNNETIPVNDLVLEFIKKEKINHVILVCYWIGHFTKSKNEVLRNTQFGPALIKTVEKLKSIGCSVYLCKSIPEHKFDPIKLAINRELFKSDIKPFTASIETVELSWKPMLPYEISLLNLGVRFIDFSKVIIDKDSGFYLIEDEGGLLYHDQKHLTPHGAKKAMQLFEGIWSSNNLNES